MDPPPTTNGHATHLPLPNNGGRHTATMRPGTTNTTTARRHRDHPGRSTSQTRRRNLRNRKPHESRKGWRLCGAQRMLDLLLQRHRDARAARSLPTYPHLHVAALPGGNESPAKNSLPQTTTPPNRDFEHRRRHGNAHHGGNQQPTATTVHDESELCQPQGTQAPTNAGRRPTEHLGTWNSISRKHKETHFPMCKVQKLDDHRSIRRHQHDHDMQRTIMHQQDYFHGHQGTAQADQDQAPGQIGRAPEIPTMGSLRNQQLPSVQRTDVSNNTTEPPGQQHRNAPARSTNLDTTVGTANARIGRYDESNYQCTQSEPRPQTIKEARSRFHHSPPTLNDDYCKPRETTAEDEAIYGLVKIVMYIHLPTMPHAVCMLAVTDIAEHLCMSGQKHVRVSSMWSFVGTLSRIGGSTLSLVVIYA